MTSHPSDEGLIARNCGTCRYWDRLSIGSLKGDCRAPGDHRYSHVPMPNGQTAMLDSFGPEETHKSYRCGAWQQGQEGGPIFVGDLLKGNPHV